MRNRARIGLLAVALTVATAGRGCVTAPPPTAESIVAGASDPNPRSSTVVPSADATKPPDLPSAPVTAPEVPPAPSTPSAQTPDERRTALDKQLDASIGAFDDRLKKEQQKISEEHDARQATVAATASADGSTETPSGSRGGPSGSPGGREKKRGGPNSPHAGDLKSDNATAPTASASGNGALATIVPDGNDDDIVARRIRKAAEQETDPELKDRLWKEYVEYKKNSQVR